MKHVFEHNGQRFMYDVDSDACTTEAFFAAYNAWSFQQQIAADPPQSLRQYRQTGATDVDMEAFSFLLFEVDEHDQPIEKKNYAEQVSHAADFLRTLPARHVPQLLECRTDFFGVAGLYNVASMKELAALYGASTNGAVGAELLRHVAQNAIVEQSLNNATPTENSFTSPANSSADSAPETPTDPNTSGPTDSSPEEAGGKSTESDE